MYKLEIFSSNFDINWNNNWNFILILSLLEASIVKYNKEKSVKALYIFGMLYLYERNLPAAAAATYQKLLPFVKYVTI